MGNTASNGLIFPEYDEDDLIDWDAHIATPPPRKSGTIRVKLKYVGRSKPMPLILDDCDCEGCSEPTTDN